MSEKFIVKEKIKVYELAKAVGQDSFFLLDQLENLGIEVRNHMSSLSPEQANRAIAALKKNGLGIAAIGKSLLAPKNKPTDPKELRVLVLSEHLKELRNSMSDQRHKNFSKRHHDYLKTQNDRAKTLDRAMEEFAGESFSLSKLKKGLSLAKVFASQIGTGPEMPDLESASDEERVICAGLEGEAKIQNIIAKAFDGKSLLLCGLMSGYGEVDFVLIGPSGVTAIEVKRKNGIVSCDGDRWWYDKLDNSGKMVESNVAFADSRGRSPSVQLNEIADSLERALGAKDIQIKVRRVVVLADKKSKIGRLKNVTVDDVVIAEVLGEKLHGSGTTAHISSKQVEKTARELQALHERFTAKRKARR